MISVLISMFDEEWTVNQSIKNIRRVFADAHVFVVQSESGARVEGADDTALQQNLAGTVKRYELAARALCRNFSIAFQNAKPESEFIVALTGDTYVKDPTNFLRRYGEMQRGGKVLACSQAIGQNFHSVDSDPAAGRCGGRIQHYGISDFMPQFWMVEGNFARQTQAFRNIVVTNPFTSEQCLGDEFMRHVKGPFRNNALVVSDNAYQYKDGIKYHIRRQP